MTLVSTGYYECFKSSTEIIAPDPSTKSEDWIIGQNIVGKNSGAYHAKVERVYNDENIIVI